MGIKVALNHWTHYQYDRSISLGPQVVRLKPAAHCRTKILSYSLRVTPEEHFINWQQDPFGNYLARLVFPDKTKELRIEVDLLVDLTVINPFDFFVEPEAEQYPVKYNDDIKRELQPYLEPMDKHPLLEAWLAKNKPLDAPINDWLVELNQCVQKDISYNLRMEPGVQTIGETLTIRSGSCRDSGWLLVEALRACGLAARFVSGYLVQLTPDEKPIGDGPAGTDKDFTDLHAWAEVYLPGAGWVGLDPTSGLFAGEGHIPLACTPAPSSAAPISGATDKCETEFSYSNTVARIDEQPRVTKPLSDEAWEQVLKSGATVDKRLEQQDMRLTMGGEPTFVSIDDMESDEWNTAALGEKKLELASNLMKGMQDAYGKGGITQFAQGKWYPGEPTPRWALTCYWRSDGKPLWSDSSLLAMPGGANNPGASKKGGNKTREKVVPAFMEALIAELGLSNKFVRELYEDPLHHLQLESMLPEGKSLASLKLGDDTERWMLARKLSQGLDNPTAWLIPLRHTSKGWISCFWPSRRDELFLIPGDSPAGLRLPLDSLPNPFDQHDEAVHAFPEDAFDPQDPLPDPKKLKKPSAKSTSAEYKGVFPTALCVEVRDNDLYLFLPPLRSAGSYVTLLAAIERAASQVGTRLIIEGYEPPHDARLKNFRITPDPGVIEVNIHPSRTFTELVDKTETLYELAKECRLSAEKFMLDGRHTGTGGGNHVTFGGEKPGDSPFLRRPDLLGSVITYWQHHPALSYLFSGMFIGPTSQAPRCDEARVETLYELEMALQRLPQPGDDDQSEPQPWLVDRLLRHLLIDLTGNTHRAEICIDKLYSPDSPTGRLGIVELRAFEMPPHARMSVVQALLLRALLSRFWDKPYTGKLIRWGTELHDRFMLPHYLWKDLLDIVDDVQDSNFEFDAQWLKAFWEFRFPLYGTRYVGDIMLELRAAIEPWHVLGEEATGSGTARYVDSSMERLQLRVTGLIDERYKITCNGHALAMRSTGEHGEYVVGVRYRAWQPSSCLHPDLPVNVPLVFDVIDTWKGRSLGGCAYHVAHPGGRSSDDYPVNANVAESRRLARFEHDMHTPTSVEQQQDNFSTAGFFNDVKATDGIKPITELPANPEYPHTADLRKSW